MRGHNCPKRKGDQKKCKAEKTMKIILDNMKANMGEPNFLIGKGCRMQKLTDKVKF